MPDAALTSPAQNARSREEWAEIINADWRKSIESIIHVGRDLVAAKSELPHGEYSEMCRNDLDFSPRTAQQLVLIARDPNIENARSRALLPPSWRVLSNLVGLSPDDFERGIETGIIRPDTSLRESEAFRRVQTTPKGEAWGEDRAPTGLPTPAEARRVARSTGRMVSASDGNLYSGTTEEEDADYLSRREQTYGVMDAIKTLADVGVTPGDWLDQSKAHWLNRFDVGDLERAVAWLEQLRADYFQREGIIDAD